MSVWRQVAGEDFVTHCPIALSLVDDFTGRTILGPLEVSLDAQDGTAWRPTRITVVRTPGGLYTYPGLGRTANPAGQPSRRYRVRFQAEYYRPAYRFDGDGLEYDVPPFDDTNPPAVSPVMPERVIFLPAAHYPFPAHVRVLHGVVEDAGGARVADARVSEGTLEMVLSNDDGAFSLPLRWPPRNALVTIDALHGRTGRAGSINVQLPTGLQDSHTVVVS